VRHPPSFLEDADRFLSPPPESGGPEPRWASRLHPQKPEADPDFGHFAVGVWVEFRGSRLMHAAKKKKKEERKKKEKKRQNI
jgi:hypothetical protein